MKKQKVILGCLFSLCIFFIGTLAVDASSSYKYCQYKLSKDFVYNEDGDTVGEDIYVSIVYQNNTWVSFTYDNVMYDNYAYMFTQENTTVVNGPEWQKIFVNGNCPDTVESNRAFKEKDLSYDWTFKNIVSGVSASEWPFEFKLVGEPIVYDSSNTKSSLSCDYDAKFLGDRAKNLPFFFENGDKTKKTYNLINITFSVDDLFKPKVIVDSSLGKPTSKNPDFNDRLLDVLAGNYISKHNDYVPYTDKHSTSAYKYLLDSLKNGQCPSYMVYNQPDGYYIADWEVSSKGNPNLRGVDNDYTVYAVTYTRQCNSLISKYDNILNKAKSDTDNIKTKIETFVANKNLTQNDYEQIKNEILQVKNDLNGISTEEYNKVFSGSCSESEGSRIASEQQKIMKTLTGHDTDDLPTFLDKAILESTVFSEEEKEKTVEDSSDFFDIMAEEFTNFLLGISTDPLKCETLFGDFDNPETFGGFLQLLFNYVKIIAPILVIIFGSLDFGKAVLSSDQDAIKKAGQNFAKRLIAAVVIFFLPDLIMLLLQLVNDQFSNIDPSCMLK